MYFNISSEPVSDRLDRTCSRTLIYSCIPCLPVIVVLDQWRLIEDRTLPITVNGQWIQNRTDPILVERNRDTSLVSSLLGTTLHFRPMKMCVMLGRDINRLLVVELYFTMCPSSCEHCADCDFSTLPISDYLLPNQPSP